MNPIGVRAYDFGKSDPETLASRIAEAGFETCQLVIPGSISGMDDMLKLTGEDIERISRAFSYENVGISVLGAPQDLSSPDPGQSERALATELRAIECAQALGVPAIVSETSIAALSPEQRREGFPRVAQIVRRAVRYAAAHDVKFTIECFKPHCVNSPEMFDQLLDAVDGDSHLGLVLDPANLLSRSTLPRQKEIISSWLSHFAPRIAAIHLKDFTYGKDGKYEPVPLGKGQFDFAPVRAALRRIPDWAPLIREELAPDDSWTDICFMKSLEEPQGEGAALSDPKGA
ncbi:MAG: sugar phosphate isomerase/epimerase [Aeromonadales bacterium]|nr:sugar phosphate isomerase/epimerase [Aeromonadales bacterium]MDY2892040.1 sugar phosphate isomerase/epimerase family protein [Succinivibrio sp.]